MNRRQVIFAAGGAGLALVGGGVAWRVTRLPTTARIAWETAMPVVDVRLDALRHAILAPNPHNRQPWLLRLDADDGIVVSCDLAKRLPQTDPFDRQIVIGFGAFCETAAIAAARRGYHVTVEPFPAGLPGERLDARPIARLRFVADPGMAPEPLAAFITARRSTKTAYDPARPATPAQLDRFRALATPSVRVGATTDTATLAPLRQIIVGAFDTEYRTPRTLRESIDVMRIGHAEVDADPDGIDLAGPMIEALRLAGQIDRTSLADPSSMAYRTGLDQQLAIYGAVPGALWLTTSGNSRAEQFAAGQTYVRANLLATRLGLAMHPASQALQEYPEVAPAFARVHRLLGKDDGERIQMLARLGRATAVDPAPRRPLSNFLNV